jgi:hypothetical protein
MATLSRGPLSTTKYEVNTTALQAFLDVKSGSVAYLRVRIYLPQL